MNPEFKSFEQVLNKLIEHDISNILEQPQGQDIVQLCLNHAKENTSGIIGERNIITVHLYGSMLKDKKEKSPEITRMENLLRNAKGYRKILFEDLLHYAMKSHELVDEGIIDKVIFTKSNGLSDAVPINHSELEPFSASKENFIGGSYGRGRCVDYILNEIRSSKVLFIKHPPYFSLRPIRDAILHKPIYNIWDKIEAKIFGIVLEGVTKFTLSDRLYYLLRGTTTERILEKCAEMQIAHK